MSAASLQIVYDTGETYTIAATDDGKPVHIPAGNFRAKSGKWTDDTALGRTTWVSVAGIGGGQLDTRVYTVNAGPVRIGFNPPNIRAQWFDVVVTPAESKVTLHPLVNGYQMSFDACRPDIEATLLPGFVSHVRLWTNSLLTGTRNEHWVGEWAARGFNFVQTVTPRSLEKAPIPRMADDPANFDVFKREWKNGNIKRRIDRVKTLAPRTVWEFGNEIFQIKKYMPADINNPSGRARLLDEMYGPMAEYIGRDNCCCASVLTHFSLRDGLEKMKESGWLDGGLFKYIGVHPYYYVAGTTKERLAATMTADFKFLKTYTDAAGIDAMMSSEYNLNDPGKQSVVLDWMPTYLRVMRQFISGPTVYYCAAKTARSSLYPWWLDPTQAKPSIVFPELLSMLRTNSVTEVVPVVP